MLIPYGVLLGGHALWSFCRWNVALPAEWGRQMGGGAAPCPPHTASQGRSWGSNLPPHTPRFRLVQQPHAPSGKPLCLLGGETWANFDLSACFLLLPAFEWMCLRCSRQSLQKDGWAVRPSTARDDGTHMSPPRQHQPARVCVCHVCTACCELPLPLRPGGPAEALGTVRVLQAELSAFGIPILWSPTVAVTTASPRGAGVPRELPSPCRAAHVVVPMPPGASAHDAAGWGLCTRGLSDVSSCQ